MKHVVKPSTRLVVEIEGKDYQLRRPNLGALIDFEQNLEIARESNKAGKVYNVLLDLVVSCGLPKDVALSLEDDQLKDLIDGMNTAKKNDQAPSQSSTQP